MPADLYLRIAGIAGDSVDKAHRAWIEIDSMDAGLEQAAGGSGGSGGAGGGAGAGKVTARPLMMTARSSIATPLVFEAVAKGTHFPDATLESVRAGERQDVMLRCDVEDLRLVSLDLAGAEAGFADRFGIVARRIRISFFPQDPKGGIGAPVTRGWDFAAHKPW